MKSVAFLSAVVLSLAASASFAESSTGTVEALHIHDHYSQFIIKGETAQKMYERLQVPEKEDVNGGGQKMGSFSKISVDGRMWCNHIPQGADFYIPAAQGTFSCQVTFDSTSGEINQTWKK